MHVLPRARVLLAVAAAPCAALLLAACHRQRPALPYVDSFASGSMREWTVFGGNWHASQGIVQNNSDDRGAKLVTGPASLTAYKVSSDVRLTSGFGDAGLLIRVTNAEEGANAFDGYYVGLRLPDSLLVGKVDGGFRPLAQVKTRQPAAPNVWHHLDVSMQGCDLHATLTDADGQPMAESRVHDDGCYPAGSFGLRSFESGGMWRNVQVRALP